MGLRLLQHPPCSLSPCSSGRQPHSPGPEAGAGEWEEEKVAPALGIQGWTQLGQRKQRWPGLHHPAEPVPTAVSLLLPFPSASTSLPASHSPALPPAINGSWCVAILLHKWVSVHLKDELHSKLRGPCGYGVAGSTRSPRAVARGAGQGTPHMSLWKTAGSFALGLSPFT